MVQASGKLKYPETGPVSISYSFGELTVTQEMVATMMGYGGEHAPEPIPVVINEVLSEAAAFSEISGGYLLVQDFRIPEDKKTIMPGGRLLHTERIIASSLREAETIMIFMCTAGIQYELRSREQLLHGDQIKGYVLDVLGSITVEQALNRLRLYIENKLAPFGLKMTNPYSPGYCGWPVSDQSVLFSFFPAGFAGISLSESSLMSPIKSISGIIGVGEKVKKRAYRCEICDHPTCIYRNLLQPEQVPG